MIRREGLPTNCVGLSLLLFVWLATNAEAQTPRPRPFPPASGSSAAPPAAGPAARPAEQQARAEAGAPRPSAEKIPADYKLSPELEQILKVWEQHTAKIKRMEGEFERFEYDSIFQVQTRSVGAYWYEAPDKGRMDFRPDESVRSGAKTEVKGVMYEVKSGDEEKWICDGNRLLSIDETRKQYIEIQLPEEYRGEGIRNSPLPFLFGMNAEEFAARYMMQLGSMHNPRPSDGSTPWIHIVAFPLREEQRREFQRAEVLVDPKTFYPFAVKLFDTTGNKETVYKFTAHREARIPWFPNRFNHNLRGYQCIETQQAPPRTTSNRPLFPPLGADRTAHGPADSVTK